MNNNESIMICSMLGTDNITFWIPIQDIIIIIIIGIINAIILKVKNIHMIFKFLASINGIICL